LKVAVVVRKIFHRERHVGVFEELAIFIAVEIKGRGDEYFGTDRFPYPSRQFGLWARDAAYGHGPVQAEVNTFERLVRADLSDHFADEGFIGILSDPSRSRVGFGP
jgi:hypothetical protein